MASVINTNIASLNTQRNLSASQGSLNTSIQRLSSGLRINSAKDDASGMAIATKMDSQIRGMDVAVRNANDAISMTQTAEGGLSKISDALQRMRELAVQGANATTDNASLAEEFSQLQAEITRVTGATKFNDKQVLGADAANAFTFQVGSGTTAGEDTIDVTLTDYSAAASKVALASDAAGTPLAIDTAANATAAITAIDDALTEVNTGRAKLGAVQNRFDAVVSNLQVSIESQTAAKSRIMDTDFAAETAKMTRAQILQQAGTAMLAQANQLPNSVMTLLRG